MVRDYFGEIPADLQKIRFTMTLRCSLDKRNAGQWNIIGSILGRNKKYEFHDLVYIYGSDVKLSLQANNPQTLSSIGSRNGGNC